MKNGMVGEIGEGGAFIARAKYPDELQRSLSTSSLKSRRSERIKSFVEKWNIKGKLLGLLKMLGVSGLTTGVFIGLQKGYDELTKDDENESNITMENSYVTNNINIYNTTEGNIVDERTEELKRRTEGLEDDLAQSLRMLKWLESTNQTITVQSAAIIDNLERQIEENKYQLWDRTRTLSNFMKGVTKDQLELEGKKDDEKLTFEGKLTPELIRFVQLNKYAIKDEIEKLDKKYSVV